MNESAFPLFERLPLAAIVEDTGKIGNLYQSKGYQIEVLDPRAILYSNSRITKQIRRGQFDSIRFGFMVLFEVDMSMSVSLVLA